ncbi:hypothetical protein POTOM_024485 [Populus tomentosa]|uniref:Cellulose synthase-like protein E6 n=1 Tax=Populus tomentosa TaxID=118781 RepID=A0A8X7ZMF0_POPTO|nr:hypothetical protein POTOM_024485 [Populus tomentosa]
MGSNNGYLPLFETKSSRRPFLIKLYVLTISVAICMIWVYRVRYLPVEGILERWAWIGMFFAELWFSFYWFITHLVRWNLIFRYTFKDRLSQRAESSGIKLYGDMKNRIEVTSKQGQVPEKIRKEHKGFSEWDFVSSRHDHQTIVQILIDGRDPLAMDNEGQRLPTLVYLSREKRPQYPHNFKAGAMNALIRVSSRISNGPIIMNVDCDMYSNNSSSLRDALCFFMDEEKGHEIGYVQYPQSMMNVTKNDLYGNSLNVIFKMEFPGIDANGGPMYIGTGCFHRRVNLCERKHCNEHKVDWKRVADIKIEGNARDLEEECKVLASCAYEENTQWGIEVGLKYGCLLEDGMTGFSIRCRGWRSVYFNPERKGFLGLAPTTLLQTLVQQERWSGGELQILLSRHGPFFDGYKNIPLKLLLSYCIYFLWAANCFPTLYYVVVPSLCLLRGISLFPKTGRKLYVPQASSPWIHAFAYAFFADRAYGLVEFLWCDGTFQGWWNDQRMWMFKRTTSYLVGFCDTILKMLGFTNHAFVVTDKVASEDASKRYEQEIMEFGVPSPTFNILATLALLNIFSFIGGIKMVLSDVENKVLDLFTSQIVLSGLIVLINLPVYEGLFVREDSGRIPNSVTYKSLIVSLLACSIALH